MDTFSLLTGIASGAAASLICQRVVIELRSQRVKKAQRSTVRIDVLDRRIQAIEQQIAARVSDNAKTLSTFNDRLKALEQHLSARATTNAKTLSTVNDRLQSLKQQLSAQATTNAQTLSTFNDRINRITARIDDFERSVADKSGSFDKRLDVHDQRMMQDEMIHAEFAHKIGARLHELEAKLSGISDVMRGAQHAQD